MKHPLYPVMCAAAAAAGILALAFMPASAGPQIPQAKKIGAPVRALAPVLLKKLTTPTPREVILESIKALPRPAAPVAQAARPAGAPVRMQMRQGAGKNKPAAATSAGGAAPIAVLNTGYDKIDWRAGVFISPFAVPRYGQMNWPVAMLTTRYVDSMKTQDPGLVVLDWPADTRYYSIYDNTIEAVIELPEEAALYTITLKAVRSDGLCSARWVQDRTRAGSVPLQVRCSGALVPMTKLVDDTGFVGVVSIEPGPPKDGSYYGMRGYNVTVSVDATTWLSNPEEPLPVPAPLVFAGIVITRL